MKNSLLLLTFALSVLLYPASLVYSMEPADSSEADRLYKKADDFWRDVQYDSSNFYFEKASSIFEKYKSWKNFIECQKNMGINYRYLGNYTQAFVHLNNGLDAVSRLNENQDSLRAELYNNIGNIYFEKGNYDKAYKYFKNMLEINERIFGEKHPNTGKGYQNVGLFYSRTGEYDKAIQYFKKALEIWDSTLTKGNLLFANCYKNLSEVYFLKEDYSRSIDYEEQALRIWEDKLGEGHPFVASGYSSLADKYSITGKFTEALENEYKAMQIRRDFTGEESSGVASSYIDIGKIFLRMGNLSNGEYFLNKSLSIYRKTGPSNSGLSQAYILAGDLAGMKENYETAEAYYDSALSVVWPEYKLDISEQGDFDKIPDVSGFLTPLYKKGNIFFDAAEKNGDRLILIKAFNTLNLASGIIEKQRTRFDTDEAKSKLLQISDEVNKKGVLVSLELYRLEKSPSYFESAFRFSERNKSGIITEAAAGLDTGNALGLPDSLLAEEKDLRSDLLLYQAKQEEAEKSNDLAAIGNNRNILFETRRKYDKLHKYLLQNFPAYNKLKYPDELSSPDEIMKLLPKDAAVVEYFTGDTTLTIFTITKYTLNAVTVDYQIGFFNKVREFRESLRDRNYLGYLSSSSELYSKLVEPIKPFLKDVKKLYIIPDQILTYLPFEALLTEKQSRRFNGDFSVLPYLINDYEISYQYSAVLLKESLLNKNRNPRMSFAGFAPVFPMDPYHTDLISAIIDTSMNSNSHGYPEASLKKFPPIPETETEIKTIGEIFSEHSFRSQLYLNEASSKEALTSDKLYDYNYIHLAVPGFINDLHPGRSGLVVYGAESDSTQPEIVHTGDIYNLNLNADLLVLDACESGLGREVKGEGIYALTRSAFYAGANNVIFSTWRAPGEAAPILMSLFYKYVLDGMNYSAALRKAKLDLIKGGVFSYPFEWSSPVLAGR